MGQKKNKDNNTKVTPTGPGKMLLLLLFAMLIASINYSNNMAYILCFLLTGLVMIAYLVTRNNLKGLHIANVLSQPVFACEELHINFELHNGTKGRRDAIFPIIYGQQDSEGFTGPFSVAPYSRASAKISFIAAKRGRFVLSYIHLLSQYPLGLFQARRSILVNKVYIVYPKPFGSMKWPPLEEHEDEGSEGFYVRGGDDFVGVRPYRPGESMHHIDWKAYARGRPLSIKEFTGGGSAQLWFAWNHLGSMDTEPRLSQLTRWVLEADQEGKEFGLRLLDNEINLACSPGHTVKCLESLALFKVVN
jgi:uncharacterized protein (DUF58 family)